jgi:hypothetical protein
MPLMTVREYARHRGVSHPSVLRAIESGRIRKRPDGKIDCAEADRLWEQRTDPSKPRNSVTGNPKHRRPKGGPSLPMGFREEPAREGKASGDHIQSGYSQAAALQKVFQAKREKLAFEREVGKVVEVDLVHSSTFRIARTARDRLLTLPARLAPQLAGLTDQFEMQRIIEEAVGQICAEMMASVERQRGTAS